MGSQLGIIVNPFSGRDVRRVAARASTSDHHEKQQQVTRLVLGALSQGVEKIYLGYEPFRINERAVENLPERDSVEILRYTLTHSAADTVTMSELLWEKGCRVFIVLGGDGTSRIVAGRYPDATILPLSTGTNNVFPYRLEASVAGMAAGLVATGKVPAENCIRCKRVHVDASGQHEIALIDAVLLRNDFIGSLLPFEADNLATIVLTRAEPASVGISPIGGFVAPTGHHDEGGVTAECHPGAETKVTVPISPGLHQQVGLISVRSVSNGEEIQISGPGIIAFDGDRLIRLEEGDFATAKVLRDGPRIIEADKVLAEAAERGLMTTDIPAAKPVAKQVESGAEMKKLLPLIICCLLWPAAKAAEELTDRTADSETKTLVWPDGTRYVGGVVDGKRSGKGTIFWQDGTRFVGQFQNDMRNGPGTMILPDGTVYTGFFKDDELVDTEETLAANRAAEQAATLEPAELPMEADSISVPPQVDEQDVIEQPEPVVVAGADPFSEDVTSVTDVVKQELTQTVDLWAAAWEDQNVVQYLANYSADFEVPSNQSRRTWEALRRTRINRPDFIDLGITYQRFDYVETNVVDVKFRQTYKSDSYSDLTNKVLRMRKEGTDWKIVSERSR